MSKKTRQQVLADLDESGITYDVNADYSDLCQLLKGDEPEPVQVTPPQAKPVHPPFKEVPLGVGTMNDHERRLLILEERLNA